MNEDYFVYNGKNEIITHYEDGDTIKNVYNEICKNIKDKSLNSKEELTIKKGSIKNYKSKTKEDVKRDLEEYIHVNGYVMKSDNIQIGYISDPSIGNSAIEEIKNECVSQYKGGNLQNIKVNNNITYDKASFSFNKLNDKDSIKQIIAKLNKSENKVLSFTATEEISNLIFTNMDATNNEVKTNENIESNKTIEEESTQVVNRNCMGTTPIFQNKDLFPPTVGVISSYFGERWGTVHKGLDIAANQGTPIKAAFDGKVEFSGVMNGYGNVIILSHGGNKQTLYAHCSTLLKNTGDTVTKGMEIAKVGSTGDSTGPHLHFEVRINGNAVDPLEYCGQ